MFEPWKVGALLTGSLDIHENGGGRVPGLPYSYDGSDKYVLRRQEKDAGQSGPGYGITTLSILRTWCVMPIRHSTINI